MKKENISEIRRSLEPSAEMKRRVMERAAKLEAGRKTFGNEKTTADSSTIAAFGTKEKKEQNTMSVNRSEIIKVKSHLPAAVISVAACAAVVIGIAAVNMNDKNPKPLPTTSQDSMTTDDQTVTKDEELSPEDVMTVTESDGSTFTITDKDRIAAIDAIVEKTKKCHIWYGEAVPTERTLEYYVDGKQRIVEISGEQFSTYHPDSEPHPEICWVVTVDGESYALCEFTPDEPYYQLYYSTQKGGNLTFRKQNNKNNDSNNEDEFYDDPFDEEYHNEEAARKLKSIIDDIRKNSTPQYETENLYYYYEEHLPSGDDCRADCSFKLDGNYYDIELYWDSDLIRLDVCEWRDGKDLTLLYKDTQNWIAEFDEVFGSLTDVPDEFGAKPEETEELEWFGEEDTGFGAQEDELSDDMVKIPELFELTEEQAVAALKEAGLNCLIRYNFDSTKKGYVSSYYGDPDTDNYVKKGTYIAVDISLGEYDGPIEMVKPEFATWYYPTKESKLKVPVPDGLSGSYTFNIYFGTDPEYTTTADDIKNVKNITLDVNASDKELFVVYAKKNNSAEENLIRYATYEFDYTSETWTLIGELNTDELLRAK